ncbi:uncharacterized protein A4U43_C07F20130 [Asparagus officinalis]|uniref:RRM domain-containing protein n=1 Tax=Asparagus officinalis TaxID=4686 RepID=A0A5P1EDD7_ASPOF|nr:uncharacterized protein A4U43_C07F20130 [Asparagus officinalis]
MDPSTKTEPKLTTLKSKFSPPSILEREGGGGEKELGYDNDEDAGEVFVGGLAGDTTEEMLKGHFGNYGKVAAGIVSSRNYGFIAFADPTIAERVLEDEHVINGKWVNVKRFIKDGGGGGGGGNVWTDQIYVGGLAPTVTEHELCQYFQNYGVVTESVIIRDKKTLGLGVEVNQIINK